MELLNGKNMMIDSGDGEKKSVDYIKGFMSEFGVDKIDYLMLNGNMIPNNDFLNIIDNFTNQKTMDNCYLGFYETKTIYRVKGE